MRKQSGVTLVELLITIVIISIGIFPLLHALTNSVDNGLYQKNKLSAINLGKVQMDRWLNQFQLIDRFLDTTVVSYPDSITQYTPPLPTPTTTLTKESGAEFRDLHYNEAFFRIVSVFTKIPELCTLTRITYRIDLSVWQIKNPLMNESETVVINTSIGEPGFERGDELLFQLSSLYSQADSTEAF
jgi:prepilin-type N-terminal cleavage/methylation domain-containing protein